MDIDVNDADLISRLKRLEASAGESTPGFGYDALLQRHGDKQARARRRLALARGTASALVIALIAASVWRLEMRVPDASADEVDAVAEQARPQSRIVRADTYLAV